MAELLTRLANSDELEIHLYAQRIADLDVVPAKASQKRGSIIWHRVPAVPGPYLVQFVCWFFVNRFCRAWDRAAHGLRLDVVFSPGINCSDADVVLVHAVFHRLAELASLSSAGGLRGLHQRLYYRLLRSLEKRTYSNPRVNLAAVSQHTAAQLSRYFGRNDVAVVPNGVDTRYFSPEQLVPLRNSARQHWGCRPEEKVLLLIGNDWRTKGLPALLEALSISRDIPLRALVVGQEDPAPFLARAEELGLLERVTFAAPDPDVRRFYAAADILAAPTLEDSFNLPALEAMSCGMPVIVSADAGISEWLRPGVDAEILQVPSDAQELADAIRALVGDPERMFLLGENAVRTAAAFSWERHAAALLTLLQSSSRSG